HDDTIDEHAVNLENAQRVRDLFGRSQDRMPPDKTPDVAIVMIQESRDPDPIRRELGGGPQIEIGQAAETGDEDSFVPGHPLRGRLDGPFPRSMPQTKQDTHADEGGWDQQAL